MKDYIKSNKVINKYLLYVTLFVLPWQTRNVIDAVYFNDNFIEYASTSIYFTDVLIVLVLFTWLPLLLKSLKKNKLEVGPKLIFWPLMALLSWMWLSAVWADGIGLNHIISIWIAFRFTLFALFYLYLLNSVRNIKEIIWPIVWGLVFQSILAILQYFLNSSLGFRLIGESILDSTQSGVPVVIVDGIRRLRAHGSFPHANVLGGFLAVWLIVLFSWFYDVKRNWHHYLSWGAFILLGLALVVSFSRSAWLAVLIGIVMTIVLVWRKYSKRIKKIILPGLLVLLVIFPFVMNQRTAVLSRFDFNQPVEAISINSRQQQFNNFKLVFSKFPISGVGVGQYIPYLYKINQETKGWSYGSGNWVYDPSGQIGLLEPMHNIFLLAMAELGIVGFLIFGFLIYGVIKTALEEKKNKFILSQAVFSACVGLLILGMFDHYIWTLQQGRLLLFTILALVAVLSVRSGYNSKVVKS